MCVPGCHEALAKAFSRRAFFGGAGAVAAAAVAAPVMSRPAVAAPASFTSVVDLTHPLAEDFPTFFGKPQFSRKQLFSWAEHKFNLYEWTVNEHTGTHMDSPFHFSENGPSVDQIPAEQLVVPLAVIDVSAKTASNPDYQLGPDDIAAYEKEHGTIPQGSCVALASGWDRFVAEPKYRNADAGGTMHFPGFHPDTAKLLAGKGVFGVAVDTLSLDHGASKDFAFHYAWLGSGHWGLEGAANLVGLPPKGATFVLGGPKVKGATGGPARVFALV